MTGQEYTQGTMIHQLPKAPLVDRIPFLLDLARGKRVIHVGFADAGCRAMQFEADAWLHDHLNRVTTSLVGIDVDDVGVAEAVAAGYEAYVADCCDPAALDALAVEPAPLVIAGEVIEHLDSPGDFLEGMQSLVAPGGRLVVTTPNAYGLFNVFASLARREINHPDHVVMFTWRTLTALGARHGWEPVRSAVYVPAVKDVAGNGAAAKGLTIAAKVAVGTERLLVKTGRSFAADGMIVELRSTR